MRCEEEEGGERGGQKSSFHLCSLQSDAASLVFSFAFYVAPLATWRSVAFDRRRQRRRRRRCGIRASKDFSPISTCLTPPPPTSILHSVLCRNLEVSSAAEFLGERDGHATSSHYTDADDEAAARLRRRRRT